MTPLIGFAPDLEPTTPGAILDGDGFMPTVRGIESVPSWRMLADAIDPSTHGTALAAYYATDTSVYVATGSHVLNVALSPTSAPTVVDITPASYTAGDNPKFYRYGDYVILSGSSQSYTHTNTTTQMTAIAGAQRDPGFARGFYHVRWYGKEWFTSDEGDPTAFTVGSSSAAATGAFPDDDGNIVDGAALGEYAVLYKRSAVWVGRFANSTVKWAWQRVPTIDGCAYTGSLIAVRDAHYYINEHNIFRFDLGRPVPIGDAVHGYVSRLIDQTYTRIRAVFCPVNQSIVWFFGKLFATFNGERRFTKALEYHIPSGRFGVSDVEIDCPVITASRLYVNELAREFGPYEWLYGVRDGDVYARDGAAGSARLKLFLYGDDDTDSGPARVRVSYAKRPGAATLTHSVRDFIDGEIVRQVTSESANGQHDIRASGKWHQDELALSGDWTIRGVKTINPRVEGVR